MLAPIAVALAVVAVANAACPSGTVTSYTDNTVCYVFNTNITTFLNAETVCRGYNGHLVTIPNMYENLFISQRARSYFNSNVKDFWMGANDLLTQGTWGWMDGNPFSFSDWDVNQPKNQTNYDCATMKITTGRWESDNCYNAKKAFVCGFKTGGSSGGSTAKPATTQKASTARPTSSGTCPSGWTYYNGTNACYQVVSNGVSWQQAEADCVTRNSHLVSIHSLNEDIFVTGLPIPPYYHWLGFYRNDTSNTFFWTDGTPFDYTDWYTAYPDPTAGWNCGVSTYVPDPTDSDYGTWTNYLCDEDGAAGLSSYVCKLYL